MSDQAEIADNPRLTYYVDGKKVSRARFLQVSKERAPEGVVYDVARGVFSIGGPEP